MISFRCQCRFTYIVGKKKVYGPIMDNDASCARIMKYNYFINQYNDCYRYWKMIEDIK
jgi:hypothetical protein